MSGRKIPQKVENPLDNILIDIAENLNPYFKKMNFTPNMITTLSLIFGILMNFYFVKKKYYFSALFLLISYFFDCMDGNYARKYNMQTKFGDYYDHIKDWLIILIFLVLFIRNDKSISFKIVSMFLIIIILLGTYIHVGCTEKYIKKNKQHIENSESLSTVTYCPNLNYLDLTKYLGCGTFNLALILIIVLHKYV